MGRGRHTLLAVTAPNRARCFIELFALCGFGIAQPLLSVFGRAPDQFALRGASSAQIILFGVLIVLVPPLTLWCIEIAVGGLRDSWRSTLHELFLVLLVLVIAVQVIPRSVSRPLAYGLGAVVGVAAVAAKHRWEAVRIWVSYAALAPIAFVGLFVFATPTGALIGAEGASPKIEIGAPAPVVMVVLDELPLESLITSDGELDRELYPNLAALADEAHWFRNTTSVSPQTWHAIPAIVTGQMPEDGQGPGLADHPENLFTLLDAAYDLNVIESVTRLCPPSSCPGRGTRAVLGDLWEDVARVARGRWRVSEVAQDPVAVFQANRLDLFDDFVAGLSSDRNTLSYLHILLPHAPSRYLPDGTRYADFSELIGRDPTGNHWLDEAWLPRLFRQRHVLQMMFVDRMLGDLFDRLRAEGTFDQSLIVVTADHGASFEPGGAYRSNQGEPLTDASTPDLLWVPLFVKEPGQRIGEVSDANVLSIDVLPTIVDVLDIDLPWEVDGRSALGAPREDNEKPWRGVQERAFSVGVGPEVVVDGDEVWPSVLERSLDSLLPAAGDPQRLWRIGPSPELVGERLVDLRGALEPVDFELYDPGLYRATPPPGIVPALVHAYGGDLEVGDAIAVAIGGRVMATAPVFERDGQAEVGVMVDPEAVASGGEGIELFRIL
jgi:hypothetical protein